MVQCLLAVSMIMILSVKSMLMMINCLENLKMSGNYTTVQKMTEKTVFRECCLLLSSALVAFSVLTLLVGPDSSCLLIVVCSEMR